MQEITESNGDIVETNTLNDQNTRKKNGKKKGIIIGTILLALILVYSGFSVYFINHYYFNTIIDGNNYSLEVPDKVQQSIAKTAANYQLSIEGRNEITDSISGKEINLKFVFDDTLRQIKEKQKPYLWIVSVFGNQEYSLPKSVVFEETKLAQKVKALAFFDKKNVVAPEDAYIEGYSSSLKQYVLVEEIEGSTLLQAKTIEEITKVINNLNESLNLDESKCYQEPKVKSQDKALVKAFETLNKYIVTKVTYDFKNSTLEITGNEIQNWLTYEDNQVVIDPEKVHEYVKKVASEYDTYGKNRIFKTTSGNSVELKSGAYGWKIDKKAEEAQLIEDVQEGKTITREPIYQAEGYVRGADDIGSTYVEINLSAQHLYVYQNGVIAEETDFVSGNMSKGWGTPAGVFGLTYKTKDAVLKGDDYETDVSYWMPFNGNVGMHDATWRSIFGGDIYLNKGSHGCVNLPANKAKSIYELVEKGMPVICYY